PRCPAGRSCPSLASDTWGWRRWPTSGTNSTLPWVSSPRASQGAGSSSTLRRWSPAWRRWRGFGRPKGMLAGAGGGGRGAGGAAAGPAVTGLLNPVPAERARLLLAQGEVAAAARWAQERGLDADDEPDYPREREHLVLARVLLAQARPGLALALLER